MNFLKNALGQYLKQKVSNDSTSAAQKLKDVLFRSFRLKLIGCLGIVAFFFILFVVLMSSIGGVFSSMEGYYGFGGASTYGDKLTEDWAEYQKVEEEKQTFYKKLSELVEDYQKKGEKIDEPLVLSIMFYESEADLEEKYDCVESGDAESGELDCVSDEDSAFNSKKLYKDAKKIAKNMAAKSEDDFKKWLKSSYLEQKLKDDGVHLPDNAEEKEKYLDRVIEEIYERKDMYVELTFGKDDNQCITHGSEIKLCDENNSIKDFAYADQPWDRTSDQYKIFNCKAGGCDFKVYPKPGTTEYGELKLDDKGFYYIEDAGIKYYCNAMASYYTSTIGERFRITTSEGKSYYIAICDQKADVHTHAGNNDSNPNCLSGTGSMLEFYVDNRKFSGNVESNSDEDEHPFKGAVTKVEKVSKGVVNERSASENIKICSKENRGFTVAHAGQKWTPNTNQYKFWNCAKAGGCYAGNPVIEGNNGYGDLQVDDLGFIYVMSGGTKYFTAALGTYYFTDPNTAVGSKYRITTDKGNTFNIILCDTAGDSDMKRGDNDPYPYCITKIPKTFGDMYIDKARMPLKVYNKLGTTGTVMHDLDEEHKFSGTVTKIEKLYGDEVCGKNAGQPNFNNKEAWTSPINTYPMGQCTWFAAGRLYEIYGTSYDFNWLGNGKEWVGNLTKKYPEKFKFSLTPKAGAIFSATGPIPEYGHVGVVADYDGTNVTIQEGNLNGTTDPWGVAITDWRELNISYAQFKNMYPNLTYAVPIK